MRHLAEKARGGWARAPSAARQPLLARGERPPRAEAMAARERRGGPRRGRRGKRESRMVRVPRSRAVDRCRRPSPGALSGDWLTAQRTSRNSATIGILRKTINQMNVPRIH